MNEPDRLHSTQSLPRFPALSVDAQWMLMTLAGQADICGVAVGDTGLWAVHAADGTIDLVERALVELETAGTVIFDSFSNEVWMCHLPEVESCVPGRLTREVAAAVLRVRSAKIRDALNAHVVSDAVPEAAEDVQDALFVVDVPAPAPAPTQGLWAAIAEVCGLNPASMTNSERGQVGKAAKQLGTLAVTPEEVKERAGRWRNTRPPRPYELTAKWSELAAPSTRVHSPSDRTVSDFAGAQPGVSQ